MGWLDQRRAFEDLRELEDELEARGLIEADWGGDEDYPRAEELPWAV